MISKKKSAFSLLFFFIFVIVITFLVNQPVKHIKIKNTVFYSHKQNIEKITHKYLNKGIITFDIDSFREELMLAVLAKEVKIEKILPDTIEISIIETPPIAYWNDKYLLNDRMQVVLETQENENYFNIPKLYSKNSHLKELVDFYQRLKTDMYKFNLNVSNVRLTDFLSLDFDVIQDNNNIINVTFGTYDFQEKLDDLKVFLNKKNNLLDKVEKIDLRYKKAIALTWK